GDLKPGFFATARIEQPAKTPGVVIPAAAVQTTSGTSRVFIVNGDRVEERIVTTVQAVGDLVEVTKGLKAGERVATANVGQLADGMKVSCSCSGLLNSASNDRSSRPFSSSRSP